MSFPPTITAWTSASSRNEPSVSPGADEPTIISAGPIELRTRRTGRDERHSRSRRGKARRKRRCPPPRRRDCVATCALGAYAASSRQRACASCDGSRAACLRAGRGRRHTKLEVMEDWRPGSCTQPTCAPTHGLKISRSVAWFLACALTWLLPSGMTGSTGDVTSSSRRTARPRGFVGVSHGRHSQCCSSLQHTSTLPSELSRPRSASRPHPFRNGVSAARISFTQSIDHHGNAVVSGTPAELLLDCPSPIFAQRPPTDRIDV